MGFRRKFLPASLRVMGALSRFALIAATAIAAGEAAYSQDQGAVAPKDTIFARKILMDAIDDNMTDIEAVINAGKAVDLDKAQMQADTISAMLLAFPNLFPPATNQWKPNVERDPARDTFASPEAWTNFPDFYKQATAASDVAHTASRAKEQADYIKAIMSLRLACNACHADYLKTDP